VQELAKLDRYACLILDEIGYVQHDQDEMEILFTLLMRSAYPLAGAKFRLDTATPRQHQASGARG